MGKGVEEEEDVLQRRERKNSKKNKKNDNGILEVMTVYGGATNVTDEEVGLGKDGWNKKKKEDKNEKRKLELKKDEEWKNDVELISTKEKNRKKENRNFVEKDNVNVDDSEVGLRKDNRKKRKKREKKDETSDELDFNVTEEKFINDKDLGVAKNEKKRKLEHKKDEERKNDVELIVTKEKIWKKVNRNKVEKEEAGFDLGRKAVKDKEALNGKSHVVGENNNTLLGMGKDEKELETRLELELIRDKKKQKKEKRNKNKEVMGSSLTEILKDEKVGKNKENKGLESCEKEGISDIREGVECHKVKEKNKEKKEKKDKKGKLVESLAMKSSNEVSAEGKKSSYEEFGKEKDQFDRGSVAKVKQKVKDKKEGQKYKNGIEDCSKAALVEKLINERKKILYDKEVASNESKKNSVREKEELDVVAEKKYKNKRKKVNSVKDVEERIIDEGEPRTKDREGSLDQSGTSKLKGPSKRVKFSGKVEVFPLSDGADVGDKNQEENLVRGKRYSQEEDAMLKDAVLKYVRERGLGDKEGVKMVLHCRSHSKVKHCWKEIATALPWRPYESIYDRAHVLFERNEKRAWTNEEKELVRKFHEQYGPRWRLMADVLGKHRHHVKDTWRRIKLPNLKRGRWSQDEYQTLFELVNMDLRMKAFEERKSKHGMLRDNICWEAISEKLSTRSNSTCCHKWYDVLASPLVKQGKWADVDDYRLLNVLVSLDASCMDDVDWDNLLDHRPGDICRKRWNQMVRNIGEHGSKPFAEQVEVLAKRYDPNLLEVRDL